MVTLTQEGSVTSSLLAQINANFQEVSGDGTSFGSPSLWVRPQAGVGNPDGSYDRPFGSMAEATAYMVPGCVVGIEGVLREHYTTPLGINNVTIVGSSYIPRQATTSGVPNGGGATWLSPSSATNSSALIRVQGQGWTLRNIYFNNSATANGCVQPYTTGDPPSAADGAHLLIDNCILTGAAFGVYASGGTNFVRIYNSSLFGFSGSGDIAIAQTVGAGVGTLLGWEINNCRFWGNASNIVMPFNQGQVRNCIVTNGTAANINLTGGTAPNFIVGNSFNIAGDDFDPAGGTTGVTGDVWSNTLTNAIETGLPTN